MVNTSDSAACNFSLHFFNDNFEPGASFFKKNTYAGSKSNNSYYRPDLAKFTQKRLLKVKEITDDEIDNYTIARQGFAVVDMLRNSTVRAALDEYTAAGRVGYDPATSHKMKDGIEQFLALWVREQQRAGTYRAFDFDSSPVCVDTVFVVTDPAATAQGAFFAHVDLAPPASGGEDGKLPLLRYLQELGDTWLTRLYDRNAMVRERAASVFAPELRAHASAEGVGAVADVDAGAGADAGADEERRVLLLRCLAADVVSGGGRFWAFVRCEDVLNVWLALNEEGISRETCANAMGVLDATSGGGYNCERDLVPYTASRKQAGGGGGEGSGLGLPARQATFTAFGVKHAASHQWCTVQHMRLGQAYLWGSPRAPHGAMRNLRAGAEQGVRKSIDARVLFLKWDVEKHEAAVRMAGAAAMAGMQHRG